MLILLANTDGPPRRLNAIRMTCQPSTPDTADAGPGWLGPARRAIECETASSWWEWCTSLRVETSLCFSRITTKNKCENENYKRTSHSCWWVFVRHRRDHRQSQELHPGTIDTLQLCFIILRQLNFRLNTIPQRRGGPGYGRVKVWGNALTLLYNNVCGNDVLIFCCQYWNFSVW